MAMKSPCHPGELILHDWIGGPNLTMAVVVTTAMAVRLSKALGGTPRFWIQLQASYDDAQAEDMLDQFNIKRIVQAA